VVLIGCLGCTKEVYGPAIALRPDWEQTALVPRATPPPELLPPPPAPQPLWEGILPPPEEWDTWKQAQPTTVCTKPRKGRKRVCRERPPTIAEQAQDGALVRATLKNTAGSNSAMVRYTLDANPRYQKIYEVLCAVKSPCTLWLPPEEHLSSAPMLDTNEKYADTWDVGEIGLAGPRGQRQQVLGLRPRKVMDPVFVPLVFDSGLAFMLKIVSVEDGGMGLVSWAAPTPTTPPPVPLEDRPPKLRLDSLWSGYQVKVKDQQVPPWMPRSVLDDGRLTLVNLPRLDGLRGPAFFALTPTGEVRLTQFRIWTPPAQRPGVGTWAVLQGLWPAIALRDSEGYAVTIEREPLPLQGGPHAQ
jgi:hypothetical protein